MSSSSVGSRAPATRRPLRISPAIRSTTSSTRLRDGLSGFSSDRVDEAARVLDVICLLIVQINYHFAFYPASLRPRSGTPATDGGPCLPGITGAGGKLGGAVTIGRTRHQEISDVQSHHRQAQSASPGRRRCCGDDCHEGNDLFGAGQGRAQGHGRASTRLSDSRGGRAYGQEARGSHQGSYFDPDVSVDAARR